MLQHFCSLCAIAPSVAGFYSRRSVPNPKSYELVSESSDDDKDQSKEKSPEQLFISIPTIPSGAEAFSLHLHVIPASRSIKPLLWSDVLKPLASLCELTSDVDVLIGCGLGDFVVANPTVLPAIRSLHTSAASSERLDGLEKFLSVCPWSKLDYFGFSSDTVSRAYRIEQWAHSVGVTSLSVSFFKSDEAEDEVLDLPFEPAEERRWTVLDFSCGKQDAVDEKLVEGFFDYLSCSSLRLLNYTGMGLFAYVHRLYNMDDLTLNLRLRNLSDLQELFDRLSAAYYGSTSRLRYLRLWLSFADETTARTHHAWWSRQKTEFCSGLDTLHICFCGVREPACYTLAMKHFVDPLLWNLLKTAASSKTNHRLANLRVEWPTAVDLQFQFWLLANQRLNQLTNLSLSSSHSREFFDDMLRRSRKHRHAIAQWCFTVAFVRANAYHPFQDSVVVLVKPVLEAADLVSFASGSAYFKSLVASHRLVLSYRPRRCDVNEAHIAASSLIAAAMARPKRVRQSHKRKF